MFTGLVEETGRTLGLSRSADSSRLVVHAPLVASDACVGDSIAVNGCCLTIAELAGEHLTFDLLAETMARTNLRYLTTESAVNLERAILANKRFGGHFVQGHIDCTAEIISLVRSGSDQRLEIALDPSFARYVAHKGSIAVDGISLTVAEVGPSSFVSWLIPHTLNNTNLASAETGRLVNLEFDLLAKYVERVVGLRPPDSN